MTNSISGRALVLTGGHHVPTPGETNIWVCHFFLYPAGSSKRRLTMRLRGQSCPLWVCPENCMSIPFFCASESFFGWWSSNMSVFFLSTSWSNSGRSARCLPKRDAEISSRPTIITHPISSHSSCSKVILWAVRYFTARSIPPIYSWFPVIPKTP